MLLRECSSIVVIFPPTL
uniref:RuBisCO large subunit-binding protein subunit beta n=1 Tax=Arundo donax TaxID=35708 RepID=A0A0A9GCX5_ARUDO